MGEQRTDGTGWLRAHLVDVVILTLGTILTLRFWFLMLGVQDRLFMTVLASLTFAEVVKRTILAHRRGVRPRLFCAERRFDLISAIALGFAPWPIMLPLTVASPLSALPSVFALATWIRPMAGAIIVSVAACRLLSNPRRFAD